MKVLYLALAVLLSTTVDSFAAGSPFETAVSKGASLFQSVKTVVFVLGGFGLVGLACGAIFGTVKWKWFGALATGLFILAIAGAIVDYFTEAGAGGNMADTIS